MWKKKRIFTWFLLILGVSSLIRAGINFERASTSGPFAEKLVLALVWLGLGVAVLILVQHAGRGAEK
jgi:hypothetical protein